MGACTHASADGPHPTCVQARTVLSNLLRIAVHTRSAVTTADLLIGAMIVLAVILGVVAVVGIGTWALPRSDSRDERDSTPPRGADDGLARLRKIDPALIPYRQTGEIRVRMREVRALAVGPDDRVYVAGDKTIYVFDPGGERRSEIALDGQPRCLAVGGAEHAFPGRVYVGLDTNGGDQHVGLFDAEGTPEETPTLTLWDDLGEKALLTSLAVAEQDVFVADAGNSIVWHYDTSGRLKGRIGARDDRRRIPGFVIPSPYFDLAVAPDGLLRVVNPGALRIEAYTFDGDLELSWGKRAARLEGFFGCCNPVHIAILADGRLVTAEKGVPRVKVYSSGGELDYVVTGPEQLDVVAADLAVDGRDRVLILDPKARSVRILEHKKTPSRIE